MSTQTRHQDVLGVLDALDRSVADMLPRSNDPGASTRAAEAVRTFAGAVGELESYLQQLKDVKPAAKGPAASQERELEELQAEIQEKDRLIAHARTQIARWQDIIKQQEQLQENTLFAGLES